MFFTNISTLLWFLWLKVTLKAGNVEFHVEKKYRPFTRNDTNNKQNHSWKPGGAFRNASNRSIELSNQTTKQNQFRFRSPFTDLIQLSRFKNANTILLLSCCSYLWICQIMNCYIMNTPFFFGKTRSSRQARLSPLSRLQSAFARAFFRTVASEERMFDTKMVEFSQFVPDLTLENYACPEEWLFSSRGCTLYAILNKGEWVTRKKDNFRIKTKLISNHQKLIFRVWECACTFSNSYFRNDRSRMAEKSWT